MKPPFKLVPYDVERRRGGGVARFRLAPAVQGRFRVGEEASVEWGMPLVGMVSLRCVGWEGREIEAIASVTRRRAKADPGGLLLDWLESMAERRAS